MSELVLFALVFSTLQFHDMSGALHSLFTSARAVRRARAADVVMTLMVESWTGCADQSEPGDLPRKKAEFQDGNTERV